MLSQKPQVGLMEEPLPDFIGLITLSKVRLSRGLKNGNLVTALTETRHLARLFLGHEALLDSMVALTILSLEEEVIAEAERQGIEIDSWDAVAQEDIDLAQRLLIKSIAFYDPTLHHTSLALMQQEQVFERCTIISDAAWPTIFLRSFSGRKRWLFEANLFVSIAHFKDDWKQSNCRLLRVERHWNISEQQTFWDTSQPEFQIPYLRMYLISSLLKNGIVSEHDDEDPLSGLDLIIPASQE